MKKTGKTTTAPSEVQKRVLTRQSGVLRLRQGDELERVLDQIRDDLGARAREIGAHVGRVTVTLEVLRPKVDSGQ
jgi:hypothetical protein